MPKYVFHVGEAEIPKTASGKIQKFALKDRAIELLKDASIAEAAGAR